MNRVIEWVQSVALTLGGPGLFLVAFLDSSVLSLPEINDLLIIAAVIEHPERMVYYAGLATLGSIAGCWLLYVIGVNGGQALVQKRFSDRHLEMGTRLFQRYGVLAIMIPAILPPPAPFKIFVLLAGIARMSRWQFAVAVGIGRGTRYFAEGLLAIWYGEYAIEFLRENGRIVFIVLGVLTLVGALAFVYWRGRPGVPAARF